MFGKQGYNIKIRSGKDLHGRTQLKLRPDAREATFLRTKLASDIHNRLGLPTVSANYATLYINDEYYGLYLLLDAIKKSWIQYEYGDENTTSLYECTSVNSDLSVENSVKTCVNANDDVTDNTEFVNFLTALNNANSAEDIEDIFDIDLFLKEIAYEYLSGSWDHFLIYGHNYFLYKPKDDKWKFIINDFDSDFGQDISVGYLGMSGKLVIVENTDFPTYAFNEWAHLPRRIIDILIFNDTTRFKNILKQFVNDAFNPATLFPHIDKLKEFVRPYVKLDKTPKEDGKCPGILNERIADYSLAQWEANCEFTTIHSAQGCTAFGLKYWILEKYRTVCKNYKFDCDPIYMDENYEYNIDKSVEGSFENDVFLIKNNKKAGSVSTPKPTETNTIEKEKPIEINATEQEKPTETSTKEQEKPVETSNIEPVETSTSESQSIIPETTTKITITKVETKIEKTKTTKTKKN